MGTQTMTLPTKFAAAGLLLLAMVSGAVSATEQQLSCKGQMIEPTGEAKEPVDLNLKLGGARGNITIGITGSKELSARLVSDNKIQLKFGTKQYVGEFFHYTGDLFLIYPSGRLARLTCSPSGN